MRIGFISSQFPVDFKTSVYGGFKRMCMFIDAMKDIGELDMLFYVRHDLTVNANVVTEMEERLAAHWKTRLRLDLCNMSPLKTAKGPWQEYISPSLSIAKLFPYLQTAKAEQVDAVHRMFERKPDILFVHRLTSMVPVLLSKRSHSRLFFDLDDIEHVSFSRSINQPPLWPGKRLYHLRLPLIKLWERRAIRASQATFVCSDQDKQYLKRKFDSDNVAVIPNAVDIPKGTFVSDKMNLLFLGLLSFHPNTIAADHLIQNIWPSVLSVLPDARLLIAGSRPEFLTSHKESPIGVTFLGFVDDLDKLYEETAVVCCPILCGSGTRIKILEAAAYGKPVVSTTIGAEGIDLRDGEEILLRDDPESFAEACIRLLTDKSMAARIGGKAHSVIVQKYERRNVVEKIKNIMT